MGGEGGFPAGHATGIHGQASQLDWALIISCDSMKSLSCSETFSGSFLLILVQIKVKILHDFTSS